ncbi:hypothetical protein M8756_11115 [Lutimaribacter sp. EGI FJ00015]|uniref:Uncharacterized protein n=1 Tax=Lutimaribacter degradans TaxID=2945989 RepID=A0ACC5ZXZ6_9RHOB|nr:hypothetical protein [Lutimaribacter sp. EGI FJ00013]MCM2562700.1 hypothetical protein [Lutimaribacter sp. EGI FJ00013]MCO0613857.1 hypothetical protein [Lutimaribacter sp. EGI FJ00015]
MTAVPDSGAGVGFGDYSEYQQQQAARDAALIGTATPPAGVISDEVPGTGRNTPQAQAQVTQGTAPATQARPEAATEAERLAADTAALLNSGVTPVQADPSNPPPEAVNDAGISEENDFENVSNLRSIESDAQRLARNRAQYQVVQPEALPSRPGSRGPNIVDFALRTTNPKGTALYRRSGLNSQARYERNCAKYASSDRAQEDFLARGGPQRDRLGLDPDGDGFACSWDPTPFRMVRGG